MMAKLTILNNTSDQIVNSTASILPSNFKQLPAFLAVSVLYLLLGLWLWLADTNENAFLLINNQSQFLPNWFWSNATLLADTVAAVAAICLLAAFRPQLLPAAFFLLVAGSLFVHLGKQVLLIPRPPAVVDNSLFEIIGPRLTRHSFPSGHSFTALACFGLIALYLKSHMAKALLVSAASIFAISRISVGAHWPLDVAVGGGAGLAFAVAGYYLNEKYRWYRFKSLQHFTMTVITLTTLYLAWHDSRYPDTRLLSILMTLVITPIAIQQYWKPLIQSKLTSS